MFIFNYKKYFKIIYVIYETFIIIYNTLIFIKSIKMIKMS